MMQTFLPYPSFARSAAVLDRQRLGKQRVEVVQILRALTGATKGWRNHPATKMWRGYEAALASYGLIVCKEWARRGYVDNQGRVIMDIATSMGWDIGYDYATGIANFKMPPWMGNTAFHRSHRSNLLRKNYEFYHQAFPDDPDDLEYVWPEGLAVV